MRDLQSSGSWHTQSPAEAERDLERHESGWCHPADDSLPSLMDTIDLVVRQDIIDPLLADAERNGRRRNGIRAQ